MNQSVKSKSVLLKKEKKSSKRLEDHMISEPAHQSQSTLYMKLLSVETKVDG